MISPGTTLGGRYRLEERIASGGMGDVWRGVDEVLGRTIAVKILLPSLLDETGFTERFRVEARIMATVNHPGVVDIYDYGSDPAVGAYLVMEYVEGDALSRTLARVGRLTPARTMALVAQAADALHAAHEKGIVHRDVKPGNLLVRPNGTLVLTDFGIARSAGAAQLTAAGSVLGTASYISPEQAMGQSATPLSDVYALGVVAYQCLAGRRPFEGENPLEIAMRHVREAASPLPPDTPPPVRAIVERAIAKDPASRWPTAAAFAQVARRTAATLAASGRPGGGPVPSGPPVVAGRPGVGNQAAPISPPAAGVVAPPGSVPVARSIPHQPGAAYPPGAAVPPGYGRGAVNAPPHQVAGHEYLRGPVPTPPRRTGMIVAIVVVVVVIAVCVGLAIAVAQKAGKNALPSGGSRVVASVAAQSGFTVNQDNVVAGPDRVTHGVALDNVSTTKDD